MSLLSRPKMNRRWKKSLLFAVAVLLLVPSFAAAAFAMRFELAPNVQDPAQQDKEVVQKRKAEREDEEIKYAVTERSKQVREEIKRKQEMEMEMQATLLKLARVTMDQAIQIATSQTPGKVLVCSLEAKGWEEPGKLAKDGVVYYRVMIADEATPSAFTHVLVNAVDGNIIKTEKELPRKRSAENP